jgi:hypothetical protein
MGKPTIYAEALRRAAYAMGGEERLARALGIPEVKVHRWVSGEEPAPLDAYHKALDLLISTGAS